MVSLEAMLLACALDAKEARHVAVTKIPGAFLHADMEQDVHMLLEESISELMVKLAMSYVKLKKVLYGTLQAALLFWKFLSNTLKEWGFKLNENDQ